MIYQRVNITRRYKHEAIQAIIDLENRGYEVVSPLTEISSEGKVFDKDTYNRSIFVSNTLRSCWKAQMRRVVE